MMTDSKSAFTTHGKALVVILDRSIMQSLLPKKKTAQTQEVIRKSIIKPKSSLYLSVTLVVS